MGTLEATARVYAAAVAGPVHGIASSMLGEFERELATTRTFLSRVPEGKLEWRPHPKSMTAGQLALHIAEVPLGVLSMAMLDEAEKKAQQPAKPPVQPAINTGGVVTKS